MRQHLFGDLDLESGDLLRFVYNEWGWRYEVRRGFEYAKQLLHYSEHHKRIITQ